MSLSIDVNQIFTYAEMIVAMMMPIIALSSGFALGFGLADKIGKMFARAF